MAFKIKDGIRIGVVDVFNNTATTLKLSDGDTTPQYGSLVTATPLSADRTYTLPDQTGTLFINYVSGPGLILGRKTTGAGAIEELAGADLFTILNATATTSVLDLGNGGTNASLTAAAGGIVYSDASKLQITAAGSSGQILQSAGTSAPAWSTATYPSTAGTSGTILRSNGTNWVNTSATYPTTTTINQILYSSAANTISGITAANNGVLATDGTGVPAYVTTSGLVTFINTPTSANLAALVTDETGTDKLVFNTSPSFVTSIDGGATFSAFASSTTLTVGYSGTDSSTLNIDTGAVANTKTKAINIGTGGVTGSTTTITLGSTIGTTVIVNGDLTVKGTTTTVESETLTVNDNIIVLNNNVTGTPTENAGIEVERGTSANVSVLWDETSDRWTFTNDGSTYNNMLLASDFTLSTETGAVIRLAVNGVNKEITLAVAQTDSTNGLTISESGNTITFAHANTSTLSGAYGTNGIGSITVDAMGHVTAVTATTFLTTQSNDFGTVTVSDTDSGYTWAATGSAVSDTTGDTLTVVSGKGINVDVDSTNDAIRITTTGSDYAYSEALTVTVASPTANTAFNLDSWTKADFRAIKYIIGVVQGTTLYQTSELMVFNDGSTGQMTEYAVFSNDATKEVTYTIDFSGATAYLKAATPTATTSITFKIHRTLIAI